MQNSGYVQERKTKNLKSSAKLCDKTIQKLSKNYCTTYRVKRGKKGTTITFGSIGHTHTQKKKKEEEEGHH